MLSVTAINDQPNIEKLIDCQCYSSLQKLLRITVRVLEFIHILKVKTKHVGEDDTTSTKPNHTQSAELLWIQATQKQLSQDPHFDKLKGQFGLFLDDGGVWRCGGCLSKA